MTRLTKVSFSRQRNFIHFTLRGMISVLKNLSCSQVVTPEESADFLQVAHTVEQFSKTIFSHAARRQAMEFSLSPKLKLKGEKY